MQCPPYTDKMNINGINSLYSLEIKYNYPLCDSWYIVFRRNSRLIQDESVSRNGGVSPSLYRYQQRKDETMQYLSAKEIAEKWDVSPILVRRLCRQNRIPGALCKDGVWSIPEDAVCVERTVLEHTEEPKLPELTKKLQNQKKKRNFHSLYDFVVIDFTYSSCRMASCRLTRQQVETIFKKGKIREAFEPFKVSDVIEVLNHIHCVDYILDHVMEPLTQKFIRKLHHLLMTGTVDEYKEQVRPGEYRTITSRPRDRQLLHPDKIHSALAELIATYEKQPEIERNHILDFHVRFEEIFPFEDGNGRVGRLLMFKECLRHDIMPFIIDDKRRSRYLRGIKEWQVDRYELVDVVMEAQDRFEAQIELQKLCAHTRLYLPADYTED